jgi:dihydrofolate synthase/folylpolyglutamate synthase
VADIQPAVEQIQARGQFGPFITYEIGTTLALLHFYRQHVQHAVLEVGLGGRLDATNVTHPLVSVITSISYDHMSILGNTLTKIATEKAGIIKANGIVVTSAQAPEALLAIATIAKQRNASLIRIGPAQGDPAQAEVDNGQLPAVRYHYQPITQSQAGQHFSISTSEYLYTNLETPLIGLHQLENATVAVAALEELRKQGIVWDEAALRNGIVNVHWPARIQIVGHNPTIIVDGAHNNDSIEKLLASLRATFPLRRLIVVLGVNKDKDLSNMIHALAEVDIVILTAANNPRATSTGKLQKLFAEYAPRVVVHVAEDSCQALKQALKLADRNDLICATGSLYLAGEALRWAAVHGDTTAAAEIEGVDH